MTLCPNEKEVQFTFFYIYFDIFEDIPFFIVQLLHFSIIQYLTSEMHVSTEKTAL